MLVPMSELAGLGEFHVLRHREYGGGIGTTPRSSRVAVRGDHEAVSNPALLLRRPTLGAALNSMLRACATALRKRPARIAHAAAGAVIWVPSRLFVSHSTRGEINMNAFEPHSQTTRRAVGSPCTHPGPFPERRQRKVMVLSVADEQPGVCRDGLHFPQGRALACCTPGRLQRDTRPPERTGAMDPTREEFAAIETS